MLVNLSALLETLISMNGPPGSVNPDLGRLYVHVDRLFPYQITGAG
jgi:hypothetical protein